MQNRFGMFIHWGIYSALGIHEQALSRFDLDYADYEALAKDFNPTEYDPREWVRLAKSAGMEYICFTTKHHDGFCLWDTAATDYNIMNTPYGRDVLKMLADACRAEGVRLSLYYSLPDWHREDAYNPSASPAHQWKSKFHEKADKDSYLAFVKQQITELLTGYGEIYTLFWDISPGYVDESVNELVRRLQPNILINDRGYDAGDFSTPEREVPEGERFTRLTEACQSVGEQSWGYREDEDYFSARYLASSIDKIMAMGGSYLLNVGPMPDGRIPEEAASLVSRVGDWYCRVRESFADAPTLRPTLTGFDRHVITERDGVTYLHFCDGLRSRAVSFSDTGARVPSRATLLNSGEELHIRHAPLPTRTDVDHIAREKYYSITGIPVDDYATEPIVIKIEWNQNNNISEVEK